MGLTNSSVGQGVFDNGLTIKKTSEHDLVVALAGNPNVGKSTIFNGLTGMNQHTGNWPGKTVTNAFGYCKKEDNSYILVDIPGTYSLLAHSAEEEVARNFICFGEPDAVVVICDATRLERNLNLVLQIMEISKNVIVCVNLMDEAKKKGISINLKLLSKILGVPVVSTVGRSKKSVSCLLDTIANRQNTANDFSIKYDEPIEQAISLLIPELDKMPLKSINSRWLALKIIENEPTLMGEINNYLGFEIDKNSEIIELIDKAKSILSDNGIDFLGYRLFPHKVLLTQRSKKRFVKKNNNYTSFLNEGYWSENDYYDHITPLLSYTLKSYSKRLRSKVITA